MNIFNRHTYFLFLNHFNLFVLHVEDLGTDCSNKPVELIIFWSKTLDFTSLTMETNFVLTAGIWLWPQEGASRQNMTTLALEVDVS